jgi:branched-chain amino acid transport system permease protein
VLLGGMILGYLNVAGLATIGSKLNEAGIDFEPTKYQFGIYGVIIVLMMLFRPTGLIPERRHKRELELGVADTPLYDVTTEGALTDRDPSDD